MASNRHKWTRHETHTLVHLLASQKYTGHPDPMAMPTALNNLLHKHDHSADIPWEEVKRKAEKILEHRPAFTNLMMRSSVPKITRVLMKSFERGLRFDGAKKDIAEETDPQNTEKTKEKRGDDDTMVHPSRMRNVHQDGGRRETNGNGNGMVTAQAAPADNDTVMVDWGGDWGGSGMAQGADDAATVVTAATSVGADWGSDWGGGGSAQGNGDTTSQGANWGGGDSTKVAGQDTKTMETEAADWRAGWGVVDSNANGTSKSGQQMTVDADADAGDGKDGEVGMEAVGWGGIDSNDNGTSTSGQEMVVEDAVTSVKAANGKDGEVGTEEAGWGGT